MQLRDFDFALPESAIAQRPAARGSSRLLVLDAAGAARHRRISDLPSLLSPGDLVVANDTAVIPARLLGHRPAGGGKVEALLLAAERDDPASWQALVRPGRRLRVGTALRFGDGPGGLDAEVVARRGDGRAVLRFAEDPLPHLDRLGHVPLPPYIRRRDDGADRRDYQTIFATRPGAVAAPTAGLHFDAPLLAALEAAGIARTEVTLHVGLGTFKPVATEALADHEMERERYEITAAAAAAITAVRARGGRVVAIGTTVVRSLESAAGENGSVRAGAGEASLFIRPGYRFKVVDALVTNFHLPRSTLLMLVSALAGRERVLAAYREALAEGYRFYSYGDAMLVRRRD